MTQAMSLITARAKIEVKRKFCKYNISGKLATVKIKTLKEKGLCRRYNGRNVFGEKYQALALYDPNKHTIFYNAKALKKYSKMVVKEVIVHELIHAVSDHSFIRIKDGLILKSGLKKQYSCDKNCKFMALNEGLVQFLSNQILDRESLAYKGEVNFVKKIMKLVGEENMTDAFLCKDEANYLNIIDRLFGINQFTRASQSLDQKNFTQAFKLFGQILNERDGTSGFMENTIGFPAQAS